LPDRRAGSDTREAVAGISRRQLGPHLARPTRHHQRRDARYRDSRSRARPRGQGEQRTDEGGMTRHVIGVDIGTQSTKSVLVADDGRLVAQASSAYHVDTPHPLWAEQWPQVWMDAVQDCIHALLHK